MVTKYNTSDIVYAPVEIISARGSDNGEIYYEVKIHGYSDKYIIAESEIRPENQVNVYYQPEKGYIGSDLTDGYIEYAKAEDGKIEAMNTQIKLLSESPASDLKKIIKEPEIYCRNDLDYADTLFELCKTELQARSVFNLVRNAFRRGVERFLEIIWSIPFRVRKSG